MVRLMREQCCPGDCRNFVNEILASRRRIVRVRGSELVLAIKSASVDVRLAKLKKPFV